MQCPKDLPLATRIEVKLTGFSLTKSLIHQVHQQRKKYYMAIERRKDRRCPSDLRNYERKVWSQFGEDGIIEEIFRRIGEGTKFAVEFGVETGVECNTRHLVENHGWSAILMDGSPYNIAEAEKLYAGKPVRVLERFITATNILDLFADAGIPHDFDLLSVDIDGNDYWVWEKILEAHRPRVTVIEYNARYVPPKRWVKPYDPEFCWDGSVNFGASLQSLTDLGARSGYKLVGCSFEGVNAFFVREDQVGNHFPTADRGAAYHFAAPLYGTGFGHPVPS